MFLSENFRLPKETPKRVRPKSELRLRSAESKYRKKVLIGKMKGFPRASAVGVLRQPCPFPGFRAAPPPRGELSTRGGQVEMSEKDKVVSKRLLELIS